MKSRNKQAIIVGHSRWLAYATAGVATACSGTRTAEADIFYSGIINFSLSGTERAEFSLGSNGYFALIHSSPGANRGLALFQIKQFYPGIGTQSFAGQIAGPYNARYVTRLASNALLSAQQFVQAFSSGTAGLGHLAVGLGYPNSQWLSTGTGFIGFRFNIGQPGGVQYGWARIRMDTGSPSHNFTLVDYAFASPGEIGLRAGQTMEVPEPATLGLLALGALGLLAWRKRRPRLSVSKGTFSSA